MAEANIILTIVKKEVAPDGSRCNLCGDDMYYKKFVLVYEPDNGRTILTFCNHCNEDMQDEQD